MTKHRYTAFLDDELVNDMKQAKALTGLSLNVQLNDAGRKFIQDKRIELVTMRKNRTSLHSMSPHI